LSQFIVIGDAPAIDDIFHVDSFCDASIGDVHVKFIMNF
jgi:hypothetical protein